MLAIPQIALLRTGVLPMIGPLQVADVSNALNSGDYSLNLLSGVTDSASAEGFVFDTQNSLTTVGARPYKFKTGGRGILDVYFEAGGGSFGFDAAVIDSSVLDAGFETVGRLKFIAPGSVGTIGFQAPSTTTVVGINPGTQSFTTSLNPLSPGVTAFLNFAAADGAQTLFTFSKQNAGLYEFLPDQSTTPRPNIGRNSGNNSHYKWGDAFFADNAQISMGNNTDAYLSWDGTDTIFDPDAQAAGGLLRINSVSSWNAIGTGTAPTLHSNLPTGAVGTTQKWLTVKDDAGATYHIPAWSNA